jgi:hypothetical protein
LFGGIIAVAYLGRFDQIRSIDYSRLRVNEESGDIRGKRILILNDRLDPYYSNHLATPFLNWHLTEDILRNPDYYENVTQVYHSFKNDPPELIIDSYDLMRNFFERMPGIKANYVRQGDRYVRISN